jgi:ribosome-binding protein aMBF1 (putative translation factor)
MSYDLSRITEERLARGWSRAKLAREAEVHESTIYYIERDQRSARPETVKKLADALGISLRDLVIVPASRKDAAA